MVCYTQCKETFGNKYNVGAVNLVLLKDILDVIDWQSVLDPLMLVSHGSILSQYTRMPLIGVFLLISRKLKRTFG